MFLTSGKLKAVTDSCDKQLPMSHNKGQSKKMLTAANHSDCFQEPDM